MSVTVEAIQFIVMLALFAALICLQVYLLFRLRRNHTPLWEQLGSPTSFFNASHKTQWAVFRFVWSAESGKQNDRVVKRVCLATRAINVALFVLFCLAVIGVLHGALSPGKTVASLPAELAALGDPSSGSLSRATRHQPRAL